MFTSGTYNFPNVSRWSREHRDTSLFVVDKQHVAQCGNGERRLNFFSYDKVIIPINQKSPGSATIGWHWLFVGENLLPNLIMRNYQLQQTTVCFMQEKRVQFVDSLYSEQKEVAFLENVKQWLNDLHKQIFDTPLDL